MNRRGSDRRRDVEVGPPPVQSNSRFAAVAADFEAERSNRERERDERGPPPVHANSRFGVFAADNDRQNEARDRERNGMDQRGAPPVPTNSRFGAFAADTQRENEMQNRDRGEHGRFDRRREDSNSDGGNRFGGRSDGRASGGGFSTRDNAGPPPVVSSRFMNLVADDEEYVSAEQRNQRNEREHNSGMFGGQQDDRDGARFERHDGGDNHRHGGGGYTNDRGGGRFSNDQGGGRREGQLELPTGPRRDRDPANEDSYFPTQTDKGKLDGFLAPKPRDEVVLPPLEAPLTLPGENEAAAKVRLEKKRREEAEKTAAEQKAAEEVAATLATAEKEAADQAAKAAALESKLIEEFVSGSKLGEELQSWCSEQASVLPTVEKLIFHLLSTNECKTPDPACHWSEPENYGTALLSLVEDDAEAQMQVLWAIQKYCDTQGFPKADDEYLVQVMFRAMYKHDLAEPGAFDLWKDDESEENSKGKMKAVIQTMDWYNWLEEDDDGEDDEEEE